MAGVQQCPFLKTCWYYLPPNLIHSSNWNIIFHPDMCLIQHNNWHHLTIFFLFFIHFLLQQVIAESSNKQENTEFSTRGVKTLTWMYTQSYPAHPQKRRLQRLRRLGLVGADSYKKTDLWWIVILLQILAIIKDVGLRLRFLWHPRLGVCLKK